MPVPEFQSLLLPPLKAFVGGGVPPHSDIREGIAVAEGLSGQYDRKSLPSGRQPVEGFGPLGRRGIDLA